MKGTIELISQIKKKFNKNVCIVCLWEIIKYIYKVSNMSHIQESMNNFDRKDCSNRERETKDSVTFFNSK